ncbi:hypothetical protein VNO77_17437 [Canavalia gladiata]|uniref:CRIB domain-containing protein n=1 Tax=Canavalia gladiata TaxID=3824 RepID=A0AAN9LJ63_CANGL
MSSSNKVKGLLKGLRFISQIFDNEKEAEIQIGNPTDVKHVAHIGWDGPTETAPSWMHEFKSVPGITPAPPNLGGEVHSKGHGLSFQHSEGNIRECQGKEKSDRPRHHHHKRPSKHSIPNDSFNGYQSPEHMDAVSLQHQRSDLPPKNESNNLKKSHHHHHHNHPPSTKTRSKAHHHRDPNSNPLSPSRSSSAKSRNKHRSFEDDGQLQRGSCEDVLRNYTN